MNFEYPLWYKLIDVTLALFMWISVLIFSLNLFLSKKKFFLNEILYKILLPIEIILFYFIPKFAHENLRYIYLFFLLFFIRYYLFPLINNKKIYGLSNLYFEGLILNLFL